MSTRSGPDLESFRATVRSWCRSHIAADWRQRQTGASDEEFVRFQQEWFQELRQAGFAVPHWPREWGGGLSVGEQTVLYEELARHDAPRLVLAFVSIHHAASTLLLAGSDEQRRRHLPAILDGEIWVQGFSEPEAGSDLASLRTTARRRGDVFVVNGQKVWASGAHFADWCLLLARTDPVAPKRRGISYFMLDMRVPGIEVRPIRQATGESHFCEIFLRDVEIPASQLIGPENDGWQVAQATLSAERGMTMLELAERLRFGGFAWLVQACSEAGPGSVRAIDDPVVRDRLASLETEIAALRGLCSRLVSRARHRRRGAGGRVRGEARLQRATPAHDGLRGRGARAARARATAEAPFQQLGVRSLGARLHRLMGVDDPRGDERDPAHDHRRARPGPAP